LEAGSSTATLVHMPELPLRDDNVALEDGPRRALDPQTGATRPTVEQMGEWSFPASDPPATWTWDVDATTRSSSVRDDARASLSE
jgi:hypothetical protein